MLSTLLYGAEEYGPEESVHIQVGNMFASFCGAFIDRLLFRSALCPGLRGRDKRRVKYKLGFSLSSCSFC